MYIITFRLYPCKVFNARMNHCKSQKIEHEIDVMDSYRLA